MSPFLIFDVKRMHRKGADFVSPTMLYSTISLYIIKVCIRTMSKGTWEKVDRQHSGKHPSHKQLLHMQRHDKD